MCAGFAGAMACGIRRCGLDIAREAVRRGNQPPTFPPNYWRSASTAGSPRCSEPESNPELQRLQSSTRPIASHAVSSGLTHACSQPMALAETGSRSSKDDHAAVYGQAFPRGRSRPRVLPAVGMARSRGQPPPLCSSLSAGVVNDSPLVQQLCLKNAAIRR